MLVQSASGAAGVAAWLNEFRTNGRGIFLNSFNELITSISALPKYPLII